MRPHTSVYQGGDCVYSNITHQPLDVDERADADAEACWEETIGDALVHQLDSGAVAPESVKPETTASHAEADQKTDIPIVSRVFRALGSLAVAPAQTGMALVRNFHS